VERRSWAAKVGLAPGDEIVEINGRSVSAIAADEFSTAMLNRPVRLRLKSSPPEAEALPTGLTDMLRAEVVCDDEEALAAAFEAICGPSPSSLGESASSTSSFSSQAEPSEEEVASEPRRPSVCFDVIRAANGFHPGRKDQPFPRAAGLVLTARFSTCQPGPEEVPVRQLVEVELLLASTLDARWLVGYLGLTSAEAGPARVRSPGQPTGFGPMRRRPLY